MTDNAPGQFDDMRAGDGDSRSRDWSGALRAEGDTVASITGVAIVRSDGETIGGGDLTWRSPAAVDASGLITTIWLSGSLGGVQYLVSITVITAQGRTLTRDAYLTVLGAVG
jgi:hypothetical protein